MSFPLSLVRELTRIASSKGRAAKSKKTDKVLLYERLEERYMLTSDPLFTSQWALEKIDAPAAWANYGTGNTGVVIGLIEQSGYDYTNKDLYKNVWLNQGEIPEAIKEELIDADSDGLFTFWDLNAQENVAFLSDSASSGYTPDVNGNEYIDAGDLLDNILWADGIDQDGLAFGGQATQYVDDLVGWNFVDDNNDPLTSTLVSAQSKEHGTQVASVLSAEHNNNFLTTGAVNKSQLMLARSIRGSELDAMEYLSKMRSYGANLRLTVHTYFAGLFNSDVETFRPELFAQIEQHSNLGILAIASAGQITGGSNLDNGSGPQSIGTVNLPNVINVGASNEQDQRWAASNFGALSVDLAAPGEDIIVINPNQLPVASYESVNGTSVSAPYVAGVVALGYSAFPQATMEEMRDAVFSGVDQVAAFDGVFATGGRLNALGTLQALEAALPPRIVNVRVTTTAAGGSQYSFNGPNNALDPDGSGEQLKTVPVGGANVIEIDFSEHVNISENQLRVVGLKTGALPTVAQNGFSYDSNTRIARWQFTEPLEAEQYALEVSDTVTDVDDKFLDGEWTNPQDIHVSANSGVSEFPSGDGIEGGDFTFVITILPGDLNRDNSVNLLTDIFPALAAIGQPGLQSFTTGDFDGDGSVNQLTDIFPALANIELTYDFTILDIAADFNGDFTVDETDLGILLPGYFAGLTGVTKAEGDANGDGILDDDDVWIWEFQFRINVSVNL